MNYNNKIKSEQKIILIQLKLNSQLKWWIYMLDDRVIRWGSIT